MITQTAITIWHKGYNSVTRLNDWTATSFGAVSLQEDVKISVLQDGPKTANVIKIRIPTTEAIDIANGDRIIKGASSSSAPPNDAYTVVGFADNRKGSKNVWHWKVICA